METATNSKNDLCNNTHVECSTQKSKLKKVNDFQHLATKGTGESDSGRPKDSDLKKQYFVCHCCKKRILHKKNLIRHMKTIHSITRKKVGINGRGNQGAICFVCDKWFKVRKNMLEHMKNIHKVVLSNETSYRLVCPLCQSSKHIRLNSLRDHLLNCHEFAVESEEHTFTTMDDFYIWKQEEELKFCTQFVTHGQLKFPSGIVKQYYRCSRSGTYLQEARERCLRPKGSAKAAVSCSASMEVIVSSPVIVTYYKTHCGHEHRIKRPKAKKYSIIGKNVSMERVLNHIRDSEQEELLTRKDLWNLEKSFDLNFKEGSVSDKPVSISQWTERMKLLGPKSPVLFYKSKGEICNHFENEDFMLVLMTPAQFEMLQKLRHKEEICIDSTHGTNCDFMLTTLSTGTGVPLAFCYSNRINEYVLKFFFVTVKEKVGKLDCKILIYNGIPAYYDTWCNVMGSCLKMHCSRYVDQKWRKELLSGVVGKDKQIHVYKLLCKLINESDRGKFKSLIENFFNQLLQDEDTKVFGFFFEMHFSKVCEEWAFCYREDIGLNTNVHLENMCRILFKCACVSCKNVKSLIESVYALMKITNGENLKRFVKFTKGVPKRRLLSYEENYDLSLTDTISEDVDQLMDIKDDVIEDVIDVIEADVIEPWSAGCETQDDPSTESGNAEQELPITEPGYVETSEVRSFEDIQDKLVILQTELENRDFDESTKCTLNNALEKLISDIKNCPLKK